MQSNEQFFFQCIRKTSICMPSFSLFVTVFYSLINTEEGSLQYRLQISQSKSFTSVDMPLLTSQGQTMQSLYNVVTISYKLGDENLFEVRYRTANIVFAYVAIVEITHVGVL